jgi:outer membrane immunogenic protein
MRSRFAVIGMAFAAVGAIALGTSQASADGYVGGPRYVAPFSWTGLYLGVHAGGEWASWDWKDNRTGVGFCAATPFGGAPCDPVSQSASSFVGGGQVGARWQTGRWVLGVEGSLAYSNLHDSGPLASTTAVNSDTRLRSMYTGTVQVGHAWDRMLWYVKGGYAGAELHRDVFLPTGGPLNSPVTQRANGWTIGTGVEYALHRNLSLGLEYDYTNLRADSVSTCTIGVASVFCGTGGTAPVRYSDFNSDIQQVVVRLNYKFGRDEPRPLK